MGPAIQEQPLGRNVKWFQGGLEFEADRFLYHSTLGLRVIKKKGGREAVRPQVVHACCLKRAAGLVLKVRRLLYHSTLGLRLIKKKKR